MGPSYWSLMRNRPLEPGSFVKDVDGSVLVPATDPCRIGLKAPLLILDGQSHVRDMNPMVKLRTGSG